MKTILITGAKGQLGQCLREVSEGINNFHLLFEDYDTLDLTNKTQVQAYFKNNVIDWCINCAAYTAVDDAEDNRKEAYNINAEAVNILSQACLQHNSKLIHISTDFVFDGKSVKPYSEEDETNPLNVYGASKLKGELQLINTLKMYFIIRTSWLYSEFGNNFVKTMLRLSQDRDVLKIVNDHIGTPTYAMDLADIIFKIIQQDSKAYGLYHYSNEGSVSWYGFAKQIFEYSDIDIQLKPVISKEFKTKANRPKYSVLDKHKIKKTFNFEIPFWEESLKVALKK